ncbi:MAG: mismatch repair protein MutT [Bacillales bacterium]|jgi:8-oxo-dGTP diphosphatase|nr:mismatch repair protein MutT [Bacillales bacterium]
MTNQTFGSPIDGVDYIERHCAYGVILNDENQVALAYCNGEYFLPGGGIEGEESPQECIKRECIEELALEVQTNDFINTAELYIQSVKTGKFYHNIGQFYFTSIIKQLDQSSEEDHILVWMDVEDAISKLQLESQSWAVSETLKIKKGIA